jgi:hypothetical protein
MLLQIPGLNQLRRWLHTSLLAQVWHSCSIAVWPTRTVICDWAGLELLLSCNTIASPDCQCRRVCARGMDDIVDMHCMLTRSGTSYPLRLTSSVASRQISITRRITATALVNPRHRPRPSLTAELMVQRHGGKVHGVDRI